MRKGYYIRQKGSLQMDKFPSGYDESYSNYYRDIAGNMKKFRKLHSLTQAELSEKMNMDSQYYAQLERFDNPSRHFTLDKILAACDVFNCTPNDIIGKTPIENSLNRTHILDQIYSGIKSLNDRQLYILQQYLEKIAPLI